MRKMRASIIFLALFSAITGEVPTQYPYQAALIVDAVKFCNGVLISNNYVLTRASCLIKAFEVDVIMNTDYLLDWNATALICTFFTYNPDSDVALIKLPREVDMNKFAKLLNATKILKKLTIVGFNMNTTKMEFREVTDGRCTDSGTCIPKKEEVCISSGSGGNTDDQFIYGASLFEGDILVGIFGNTTDSALNILKVVNWTNQVINPLIN